MPFATRVESKIVRPEAGGATDFWAKKNPLNTFPPNRELPGSSLGHRKARLLGGSGGLSLG